MEERRVFSLLQVCTSIRKRIEEAARGGPFWIKAEIATIKVVRHAYLELAEHRNGERVAVMRARIWSSDLERIQRELGNESANILREGAEILFRANVSFSEVYGLSLAIDSIDSSYNLGELEKRKRATVEALRAEGLYDLNRFVAMPMVIQRVALIASMGTAAYEDFMQHLIQNEKGYTFHVRVFTSSVQGDGAAAELRAALGRIDVSHFDAVVLIRGGGSKLDLEPFNDLELCRMVARMPIPVMTGIGHDVDVSVVDLIARSPHKTPTAIADFLVDKSLAFETSLEAILVNVHNSVLRSFTVQKEMLSLYTEMVRMRPTAQCRTRRGTLQVSAGQFARLVTEKLVDLNKVMDGHRADLSVLPKNKLAQIEAAKLRELSNALSSIAQQGLQPLISRMNGLSDTIKLLSPDKLLERGFSITRHKGTALTDPLKVNAGDEIETTFAKGRTWSTITRTESHG